MKEKDELTIAIETLESKIDRLRALYDQYFMGIEKVEPLIARKDVERLINELRKQRIRNTALRFKFQQQIQRYTLYVSYWQRIARQIEEGTYQRDIKRAKDKFGVDIGKRGIVKGIEEVKEVHLSQLNQLSSFEDMSDSKELAKSDTLKERGREVPEFYLLDKKDISRKIAFQDGSQSITSKQSKDLPFFISQPPPPPPISSKKVSSSGNDLSPENKIKRVYEEYINELKKRNLPVNITYEKIKKSLLEKVPQLQEKYNTQDIEFKVDIKDGKPIIKAVPKKVS